MDDLEQIIRPIVEGQIRGFLKEHPSILKAVDWFKPGRDKSVIFVNSLSKRIVRDLVCPRTRARLTKALLAFSTETPSLSAVEFDAAAEADQHGTVTCADPLPFPFNSA